MEKQAELRISKLEHLYYPITTSKMKEKNQEPLYGIIDMPTTQKILDNCSLDPDNNYILYHKGNHYVIPLLTHEVISNQMGV